MRSAGPYLFLWIFKANETLLLSFGCHCPAPSFPPEEMTNTKKEGEIAELLALLKDKDDEIARLKLIIGTGGTPVSVRACHLNSFQTVKNCRFVARPTPSKSTRAQSCIIVVICK